MPEIEPAERYQWSPFVLVDGLPCMIGWQEFPADKGGPSFVLLSRAWTGILKVTDRFPLNPDGWTAAWRALAASPGVGGQVPRQAGRACQGQPGARCDRRC